MQYGDDEHYYPEPPWDAEIRAMLSLPLHSKERLRAYSTLMAAMPVGPQRTAVKSRMLFEIYGGPVMIEPKMQTRGLSHPDDDFSPAEVAVAEWLRQNPGMTHWQIDPDDAPAFNEDIPPKEDE